MSEQQNATLSEVTAVDFADQARSYRQNADNFGSLKDSLISWLRTNVGSQVNTSADNLEELIIADAKDHAEKAQGYLKDVKNHLIQLTKDHFNQLTVRNAPPRDDDIDGVTKEIEDIIGWGISENEGGNSDADHQESV